jgi:signal peptidase II
MKKSHFSLFSCFLFSFALILVDACSKWLIVTYVPYGSGTEIVLWKDFLGISCSITHAINTGAAWGILSSWPLSLIALRIFLVFALIIFVLFFLQDTRYRLALLLIVGGAIGNLLDFFVYGHVIDMIHFILWGWDYPVFNIADSAICLSTFWIVIRNFCPYSK